MGEKNINSLQLPGIADKLKFVKPDGIYPNVLTDYTKNLLSDVIVPNNTPYLYRPTPADSDRERVKRLEGLSVGWNQLCNASSVTVTSGHKYYMKKASVESIGASDGTALTGLTSGTDMVIDLTILFGSAAIADHIYTLEQATEGSGVAWVKQYIDLDSYHAYSAPAIKSVEGLTSHDMVGFNVWDETTEKGYYDTTTGEKESSNNWTRTKDFIPVLPNTDYYCKITVPSSGSFGAVLFYDGDKNLISFVSNSTRIANTVFTTPENARYMTMYSSSTWFQDGVCINLSDPSRNGTYEPYEKHSYPLDSTITLRGIPKLVDGKLVADGDWYEPSGKQTVRYSEDSFDGSETWEIVASGSRTAFKATLSETKASGAAIDILVNSIDVSDSSESSSGFESVITCRSTIYASKNFYVFMPTSVATTVEQMKAWVAQHPITVVYPIATPTTSTASPYAEVQICESGGTEEFVTDSPVPVGNVTEYMFPLDIKGTFEDIEDSIDDISSIIAAEYDSTKTYAVGDFCLHSGALYECTTAITTAEAWNSAHWTLASVGGQIEELKEGISNTTSNTELLNGYKTYKATFNHGWVSASGVYNPSDNRYISEGIPTSDIKEVSNKSGSVIYVDYFTSFTDFTDFQLATYTQLNPGQSTVIDKFYPTVCVLSASTQKSDLDGILIKGESQLGYLSKLKYDNIVSDVETIESKFVELDTNNAFRATSYTLNGYWNLSNHGVFKPDSNYVAVNDYMPVDAGATYYCGAYNKTSKGREISLIAGIFIYYDENKTYVGSDQGTKASITIPAGVKYLRVSITTNTYNSYLCGLRKGSAMDYWYPPFKRVLNSDLDRVVTVGKTGTEDFYYLKEAVEFATQYDNTTVEVHQGTYDLVAEYGDDWLEAMTSTQTEKGLVLKNNIHLVFSPLSVVTFHYRGENANVQTRFSPFNSGEKGFTVEGLTLKASNCRYCVHDERSGGTEPYANKYIGCDFDFDNSLNTTWSASQIIGGGLGKQGSVFIHDCVFYTHRSTFPVAVAVSYHNHGQPDSKSLVVVKDCYFKGNNGMRFSWYGTSTLITQILVSNNSMGREIETRAETQESTVENISVIEWNNELRN